MENEFGQVCGRGGGNTREPETCPNSFSMQKALNARVLQMSYIAAISHSQKTLQSQKKLPELADSSSAVGRFVSKRELTEAKNALAAALRSLQKIANTWVWA
jgi:hypothetical protein